MTARFIKPFIDLLKSPRGLWYIIGAFVVDSMAYFGILTLMVTYFRRGWNGPTSMPASPSASSPCS